MEKHRYNPYLTKTIVLLSFLALVGLKVFSQSISATTYPFSVETGIAPEDMSSGTTMLIGPGRDNGSTALQNIGFDFWLGGTRYAQFSASANGYIRMGTLIGIPGGTNDVNNSLASFNQSPCIAPYWDDIRTAASGSQVHSKIIGVAPFRKLVVEWLNMEIPKGDNIQPRSFQLWLSESTGKIEFVYGKPGVGIPSNTLLGGASIGINRGGTTSFASISAASATVSYSTANNSNSVSIADGTKYTFTPPLPAAPAGLNFTNVGGFSMTLNWQDNANDEAGFVLYRSDDGGNTFQFITQLAANTTSYSQSQLQPLTNYAWKIYAITYGGGFSTVLEGNQSTLGFTNVSSNGTGGGNWSNPATWETGMVPNDGSNVVIKDGDVVTIDMTANAYNLQVGQGTSGTLQYEAATSRTLNVLKSIEIKPGAVLQTATSGAVVTHLLNLYENLLNNGTLDLAGAATGTSLRFLGEANSSFSGNGSVTDVYGITLAKSTLNQLVEMDLGNFSVRGLAANATTGFLTLTTGTLKISGTNTFSGTFSAGTPFINTTSGLWLNNPNFTFLGQSGDVNISGSLRITAGEFNAGAAMNNTLTMGGSTNFLLEGGTLKVAGRCSTNAVINISGGMLDICTVGNNTTLPSFDMQAGTLNLSGGQIRMVKLNSGSTGTRYDYSCAAGVIRNFTGGKLVLGVAGQTTPINGQVEFYVGGTTPTVELSEGIANLTLRTKADINTYGDLVIPANGILNIGSLFYNLHDGTLTNNGNIYVFASSIGGLVFTGTGPGVYYRGSGKASPTGSLSRVYVNHPVGLFIDPTTANNLVITNFFITRGSVFNAGKITLGAANSCTVTIGAASGTGTPGNFDVPPTFNLGASGTQFLEYLATAGSRAMGNEVNPARIVSNLTLNSAGNTITMAGGNLQVTGTLTLTNGNINLNGDTLTVGSSATSNGTLNATSATAVLHNGKLRRWLPNNSSTARLFPVGTGTTRRSASIAFTTLPATGGTLTAEFIEGATAGTGLPLTEGDLTVNSTSDAGYWRINAGDGLTGGTYTATLTASNISGVTDFTKLVLVKRANNASPWLLDGTHVTTTGSNASPVLNRTGMAGFSEFGIGLPGAAVPLATTWTGAVDTEWLNAANWSNGVPGAVTVVTIPGGMPRYPVVNINTSIKSLNLAPDAILNVANGIVLNITGN